MPQPIKVPSYFPPESGSLTFKKHGGLNHKTGTIKLIPLNKSHKVIELPADKVKIKAVYVETTRAKRGE